MKNLRRSAAILLTLVLLSLCPLAAVSAAQEDKPERAFSYEGDFETDGLGGVIERYLEKHSLGASTIAIGWYDLTSGEEYYYGADTFLHGGSTYKLPLAMLYVDRIAAGEISPEQKLGSYPLEEDLYRMIANSDNHVADVLKNALGLSSNELSRRLAQYSGLDPDTLPRAYFGGCFSPRFLIGTLRTLYDNSDKYSQILEYMKEARPDTFLSLYRGETEVAHKYGSIPSYLCDSGIVYTERPFLMTVLTHNLPGGMTTISELGAIAMDYAAYLAAQPIPTPSPTPQPTSAPTPPAPVQEKSGEPRSSWLWLVPLALAAGGGGYALSLRSRKKDGTEE